MGSTGTEEQYHLKWNDYHSSLTKCFRDLRDNDEMLDVVIISDGRTFKAHKLVLSACSPVFKDMLKKSRSQPFLQPFIFLHGVCHETIEAILDFMYNGEVSINQDDLQSFLSVAEDLRVRGLTQNESQGKGSAAADSDDDLHRGGDHGQNYHGSRKRRRNSETDDDHDDVTIEGTPRPHKSAHSSSPYHHDYSMMSSPIGNSMRRSSSSMEPIGGVSYHYLGGRDQDDPLSSLMVTRSERGWHCPDCIHVATTKGNLKSHIMSGRHKLAEKSFKCRYCDRSYSTKQSMQVHISTNHRQERDFTRSNVTGLTPPSNAPTSSSPPLLPLLEYSQHEEAEAERAKYEGKFGQQEQPPSANNDVMTSEGNYDD